MLFLGRLLRRAGAAEAAAAAAAGVGARHLDVVSVRRRVVQNLLFHARGSKEVAQTAIVGNLRSAQCSGRKLHELRPVHVGNGVVHVARGELGIAVFLHLQLVFVNDVLQRALGGIGVVGTLLQDVYGLVQVVGQEHHAAKVLNLGQEVFHGPSGKHLGVFHGAYGVHQKEVLEHRLLQLVHADGVAECLNQPLHDGAEVRLRANAHALQGV